MRTVVGMTGLLVFVVVLAFGAAQIPGVVGDKVGDDLSSLNPFQEDSVDRTGPGVLQSLTEQREFKAARGYYEVVVDLEPGNNNLPDFVSGDRVIYVGKGEVEAVVGFSELDKRRVTRLCRGAPGRAAARREAASDVPAARARRVCAAASHCRTADGQDSQDRSAARATGQP